MLAVEEGFVASSLVILALSVSDFGSCICGIQERYISPSPSGGS